MGKKRSIVKNVTRRDLLTHAGAGALLAGCSSAAGEEPSSSEEELWGKKKPAAEPNPPPGPDSPFYGIDTVVVLMMENRSFDHFLGAARFDSRYKNASVIDGLRGNESNPDDDGKPVKVHRLDDFTQEDLPHHWDEVHEQWNEGKNDGFVRVLGRKDNGDPMGYHDRAHLPFLYWLADQYTVCDRWFSSVLGATWPNRYYVHSCTSKGRKDNFPIAIPPDTIWDRLAEKGLSGKNYNAARIAWYTGGYVTSLIKNNPVTKIDEFFEDAKNGTLPSFSLVDPDFQSSDDHPSHDIRRGQVFMASVYEALAQSPQWERTLFIVTYDEHGGFYDHVPPPKVVDDDEDFRQLGFRVPAIVCGARVKRGAVVSTQFEHSSIAATLRTIFGIDSLSKRMDGANDLSSCMDPKLSKAPKAAATGMPTVTMNFERALYNRVGHHSQPMLETLEQSGEIAATHVDQRPHDERMKVWLDHAERLGVVRFTR